MTFAGNRDPGALRLGAVYGAANFGTVDIDWWAKDVRLSVRSMNGEPVRQVRSSWPTSSPKRFDETPALPAIRRPLPRPAVTSARIGNRMMSSGSDADSAAARSFGEPRSTGMACRSAASSRAQSMPAGRVAARRCG